MAVSVAVCTGLPGAAQGQEAEQAPPAPSSTVPDDYRIGPGDQLRVFVWGEEQLSATVPVRPDGKITTPGVEDMVAVGKTSAELAREIENVLAEFIRTPQVNVIIERFVGVAGAQIRLIGQVAQPQVIPYREGMTLLDAVLEVGGLGRFAAGNRARLVRTIDGERRERRIRLNDLINKGEIDQNVDLVPGDIIIVPESIF